MTARALPLATVTVALVMGILARSSALGAGFWSDDYLASAMLDRVYPSKRSPLDLFRFADGSRADAKRLVDYGYYPWWSHPEFRLSMMRPLPSALHAVDYAVLGRDARAHHLHSFLWWALMLMATAALFFSLLPRCAAAAATVFFAFDESHSVPLVWLSNRSLLIATAFGAASLVCHVRWRRSGEPLLRIASIALFALALVSGEYALPMFGYLLCCELSSPCERGGRLRALAPYAGLVACFLALWVGLGYGTAHSGLYTNPLHSPLAYLEKLSAGVPVLLGELTLGVPADSWTFGSLWPAQVFALGLCSPETWAKLPSWRTVQVALGVLSMLLSGALLFWLRTRIEREHFVRVRWLLAGAVVGVLPVLGSFITTRLVLSSSIGFAALFGSAAAYALARLRTSVPHVFRTLGLFLLAVGLIYVHGYRALIAGARSTAFYSYVSQSRTVWPMTAPLDDEKSAEQRVVMIAAADVNDAPYLPFVRIAQQKPLLRGFRLLSGGLGAHELRRIDARTLEVTVLDALGLETSIVGSLTRAASDAIYEGQHFDVAGMHVEVLATRAGQPVRTRFTFDVPLEDASLVWLCSTPQGLKRLALPEIGASLRLPPPTMPDLSKLGKKP